MPWNMYRSLLLKRKWQRKGNSRDGRRVLNPLRFFRRFVLVARQLRLLRFGFPCQFRLGFSSFDALDVLILLSPLFLRQLDSTRALAYLRSQHLIQPTTISQKRLQPADIHLVFAAPLHSLIFATVSVLYRHYRYSNNNTKRAWPKLSLSPCIHSTRTSSVGIPLHALLLYVDHRQSPRIVFLRPDCNSRVIPPFY